MKKIIAYALGIITMLGFMTYAGFESGIITATQLCIGSSCISGRNFSSKLVYRISVGSGQTHTTLKSAIDWINASGGNYKREVLIDGSEQLIADTITLNHTKPVAIRGLGYEITSLVATGGGDVAGQSMLIVNSPLEITNLMMNGKGIAKNVIEVTATDDFVQIQNVGLQQAEKGIYLNGEADMRVFNSVIYDNTAYGTYISGGSYRSANCDYTNNPVSAELYAGSGNYFSSEHDRYVIESGQIGIEYQPTTYINYSDISIFNSWFTNGATVKSGFDFTLQRDANIEMYGNIGMEDYRPHAKINLAGGTSSNTYTQNRWSKLIYTVSDIYARKWSFTSTGRLTFLPSHTKSAQIRVSGTFTTTSSQSNIKVAIIKNGNTGTQLGTMTIFLDQNSRAFNYSQNVYLDDVALNDYYELYVYPVGDNETIILQDMNMYVDSR